MGISCHSGSIINFVSNLLVANGKMFAIFHDRSSSLLSLQPPLDVWKWLHADRINQFMTHCDMVIHHIQNKKKIKYCHVS